MDKNTQEQQREAAINFGPREYLRFAGFFIGWILLGPVIGLILIFVFDASKIVFEVVSMAFIFSAFAFPFVARFWKPANSLLNKVLGNKDLKIPTIPLSAITPASRKYPWYYYLHSLWGWFLVILLIYFGIKYFVK